MTSDIMSGSLSPYTTMSVSMERSMFVTVGPELAVGRLVVLGEEVGFCVGSPDGTSEACTLGSRLGSSEKVGLDDGNPEGVVDGCSEGLKVGLDDGIIDGCHVGLLLGL